MAKPAGGAATHGERLTDEDFAFLAGLIHGEFGIRLPPNKRSLLEGRITSLVRRRGLPSIRAYCEGMRHRVDPDDLVELANRVSTNYTYFNREPQHFDTYVDEALPDRIAWRRARKQRDLRVWCAAASTGEEPWQLAMFGREVLGADYRRWKAGLLATDISVEALEHARRGVYDREQLANLRPALAPYFRERPDGRFEVADEVRSDVLFRRLNLMKPFPFQGRFDVVFCRNVLIYFDRDTVRDVAARIAERLEPGGWLFIGRSETLGRMGLELESVALGVYRRPPT